MATTRTRNAPKATSSRPANAPTGGRPAMTRSPTSISAVPMTTRAPRTRVLTRLLLRALLCRGVRLDDDCRAIGNDLGHVAGHLAAVEAHRDDGVGAHQRGV